MLREALIVRVARGKGQGLRGEVARTARRTQTHVICRGFVSSEPRVGGSGLSQEVSQHGTAGSLALML